MDVEFTLHPESTTDWANEGICRGLTHVFFGPPAERPERRVEREAVAASYCLACPVMIECRISARLNREHGFWGGENDEQRAAAGFAPRSPSRRAVIAARDTASPTPLTRAAATADLDPAGYDDHRAVAEPVMSAG